MYGTTEPFPNSIMMILTFDLQLRLIQDLHGTSYHWWRSRRQEKGTVSSLRDIPSPRSLLYLSSGSVAFEIGSVNFARSFIPTQSSRCLVTIRYAMTTVFHHPIIQAAPSSLSVNGFSHLSDQSPCLILSLDVTNRIIEETENGHLYYSTCELAWQLALLENTRTIILW
jgi:hypothetical protein